MSGPIGLTTFASIAALRAAPRARSGLEVQVLGDANLNGLAIRRFALLRGGLARTVRPLATRGLRRAAGVGEPITSASSCVT
jgi:hypothetical protein